MQSAINIVFFVWWEHESIAFKGFKQGNTNANQLKVVYKVSLSETIFDVL